MKHLIRDAIIGIFSFTGIAFLYRRHIRKKGPLVRVIAFHDVPDGIWFEGVISMLVRNYNVVTPEQFHRGMFDGTKINILITFDDGYKSWIDVCLPILQKYEAKAIFFIISGLVDIAQDTEKVETFMRERLLISPKQVLTWNGVRLLVREGHTIGGHTRTHPDLMELPAEDLENEIIEDKIKLEKESFCSIDNFAYPFGRERNFNGSTLKSLSGALYTKAFTAIPTFYTTQGPLTIPRTLLENGQGCTSIARWLGGSYDIFNTLKSK